MTSITSPEPPSSNVYSPLMQQQGRLSTFHEFPQQLFPSHYNDLALDLETPYVFAGHIGSFYFTREDALLDIKFNINALPPCLNCIVAGEFRAKDCDRTRRQDASDGDVRCCTFCEDDGSADACIETIECRIDWPDYGSAAWEEAEIRMLWNVKNGESSQCKRDRAMGKESKTAVERKQWLPSEKAVRLNGLVIWRPINTHIGDIEAKASVVKQFKDGAGNHITQCQVLDDPRRFKRQTRDHGLEYDVRDIMRTRVREWDQQEPIEKLRIMLGNMLTRQEYVESPLVPFPESPNEPTTYQPRDPDFEDICEHWSFRLNQAQAKLYEFQLQTKGRKTADKTADMWRDDLREIAPQVERYLETKLRYVKEGELEVDKASEAAQAVLTKKGEYWLRKLIPEMLAT